CLFGSDDDCRAAVDRAKAYATTVLPGKLDQTYAAIRSRAPNARVVVLGYPHLFELTSWCWFNMDLAKRTALNGGADTLASVISERARAAGDTFVDVRSAFAGQGICSGDPWIHSISWPTSDSYHPYSAGYSGGYLPALAGV